MWLHERQVFGNALKSDQSGNALESDQPASWQALSVEFTLRLNVYVHHRSATSSRLTNSFRNQP